MTPAPPARTASRSRFWLIAAIVLAALTLRPAIVSVGTVTRAIQADTGLGATAMSMLTTVPVLCLGVVAAVAAALAGRIGLDRAVAVSIALVVAGIAVRTLPPVAALFAGTVVLAAGIALGNVLIPATVKEYFPLQIGPMMAVYSVALQTGATVSAAATVPLGLAFGLDWRATLALWGVPAVLALVLWLPRARRTPDRTGSVLPATAVWRTSLGWVAALFIGLQSSVYFAMVAWLPSLLQDHGTSAATAGYLSSLIGLAGIAGGLPMPLLAARAHGSAALVVVPAALFGAGLLGLLLAPAAVPAVWCALLGLAQGAGLSLALTLFTLRARTPDGAAQLSGMAQTVGYCIAALGPLLMGWGHGVSGGWTVPLLILLATLVPLVAAGLRLAQVRYLEDLVAARAP